MSAVYTAINLLLAFIVFYKSSRTLLTRFYLASMLALSAFGVGAYFIDHAYLSVIRQPLIYLLLFIYALFPFVFIHFIAIFVHRSEIVRSKTILACIYGTGLFSYVMTILHFLPAPIMTDGHVAQTGYVYYITWMSIFFSIGVAILYDAFRKFREKGMKTNILFVSFILLLLLLPGPFTDSIIFSVWHLSAAGYFYVCTIGLIIGVYFIFRYRILVNTMYDAVKLALSVMNDLLLTTDDEFNITLARGRAVSSLLGYQDADLNGKHLSVLISQGGDLSSYRGYVLSGKIKETYFDANVMGKNGSQYPMNFSFTPMYVEQELTGFVGVGRDLRERKKLEEELRQAQKMESLGTLAGGIAHDFNNILQIILMNTLALSHKNTTPEKIEHIVDINKNAVQRGASLVQQILTFARKTEVHFDHLALNPVIEELVKMLHETFPKTIALSMRLGANLPQISADHNQVHQVLLNLCVNARDAMADGGSISIGTALVPGKLVRAKFADAMEDSYLHLSVADTGHGMDEVVRAKIFEPFFTTKGKNKGTGLGLAVVYGIVTTHRGFIDVESIVGSGSTFHIYFPVAKQAQVAADKTDGDREALRRGSESVLIVEDEDFLKEALAALLAENGYRVLTATDGYEAISVFNRNQKEIDLVITDLGLPRLNGWDALIKIREIKPGVKTIISSGYLDPDVKAGAKEVQAFIVKPFVPAEILRTVRKVLDT